MTSLTADGQAMGPSPARDMAAPDSSRVAEFPTLKGTASGRVPHHAFVTVAQRQTSPSAIPLTANDNARAGATRTRSVWRDLLFLAILAMTIAGAFWSGKLNATQRVIVVPGPSSDRHVVT